jgi:hypothetical protein
MLLKYTAFVAIFIVISTPGKCQWIDFFNRPPTIDQIEDPVEILENSGSQTIVLTGISYGGDRNYQELTITAESDKPNLIPDPTIVYEQGSTANLNFTPTQDRNGSAKIKITLDDGARYNNITQMVFEIIVIPVNGRPSFKLQPGPPPVAEGSGSIKIKDFAFDIDDGDPDEDQKLTFITTIEKITNNLTFKEEPFIDKKSGDLKYEINPNGYGKATISVFLKDDGGIENGGIDTSLESTFFITVIGENDPPTLDPISDPEPIPEDATLQQIALTGISSGDSEDQPLTITATSSNTDLISTINVNYVSPSKTGTLSYRPNANSFGTSIITVTVDDGESSNNTVSRRFNVEVFPVADTPSITDAVISGGGQNTSGLVISRNPADGEEISHFKITNILNGTLYLNNGTTRINNGNFITYAQGHAGLKFTPSSGNIGAGSFMIQAATGKGNSFLGGSKVKAEIIISNDQPTLDPIKDPEPIPEDAALQQIALTGISAGESENQKITITATSSNMDLISTINVNYISPSKTGSLSYRPNANMFGTTIITVTVDDGESDNNTVIRSFNVDVFPVADAPSITDAVISGGGQNTSGLVISRNPADGEEVSHYKITNILNGTLYLNNGTTRINNGNFITYAQGHTGLKFSLAGGNTDPGSFMVQAATGKGNTFLGGGKVKAVIAIENDPPEITSVPDSSVEISKYYSYLVEATDPNPNDKLAFTFNIPDRISPWLNAVDNNDNTASLSGIPPSGSQGIYEIIIKVTDPFGQYDSQIYNLRVDKLNNKPELTPITRNIKEDDTLNFNSSMFRDQFYDLDGEELQAVKIVNTPQNGRLFLDGVLLHGLDVIDSAQLSKLSYIPDKNYHGLDIFDWTATDGRDFAPVPARGIILIESVNDPPEIVNLEETPIIYEFGDDGKNLTDSSIVIDADGDKIVKALVRIAENYVQTEDSIFYETFDGIQYQWEPELGELLIEGITEPIVYQDILKSLIYVNQNRLSPTYNFRLFEIILYDADTFSLPYARLVNFENTFQDLDIPTGFTPNDDGVNDTWEIANLGRYEDVQISVLSRSGKVSSYDGNIVSSCMGWHPMEQRFKSLSLFEFHRLHTQ